MLNFTLIEKKWQKKWEENKIFEADISKKKKFFITFPIPYLNGAPHIGHSYTAFRTDVFARFKRMQGYNVLFPQGYHATGQPVLGVVERLRDNDPVQIKSFKLFGVSDEEIEDFKKGPKNVANYWKNRWIGDMKLGGFSIDWRRTFITTDMTPAFSKFIEWQYRTLKRKGYVTQGTHPVIWCPKDQSPTGDHDRLEGEGESPVEYTIIKFRFGDFMLPCATLRPETLFGVTNLWINPRGKYKKIKIKNEKWVVAENTIIKLRDQLRDVEIIEDIDNSELLGKFCINPLTNIEIPILPAEFVSTENTMGVVMSVPAHAPFDWAAVKEITHSLSLYNLQKKDLEPVSVIDVEGFGAFPAVEVCDKMGITSQKQKKELEEATGIIYKKEFHSGTLKHICREYSSMKVSEVKERIVKDFILKGFAEIFYDSNKIICRCGTKCHVKILENQWFLKYSDEIWKSKVRKCLRNMKILPEEARTNFENTLEWMKDKACARKSGLGTPLPWDNHWIVETLSDSTIYMAYYTIADVINESEVDIEKLDDDFFDYIFFGQGDAAEIAKNTGVKKIAIEKMRKEFEYFYPVDMRISAKDLIQNHYLFYLYHHVALLDENKWPIAIGVNGYVSLEGEKMSKSKGNILPFRDVIREFGADLVRMNISCSNEGIDDAIWYEENTKGYSSRLEFLHDVCKDFKKAGFNKTRNLEKFLLSTLDNNIQLSTGFYEDLKFRSAVNAALFDNLNNLKWYLKRTGGVKNANPKVLEEFLTSVVKLISPLSPHLSEELWSILGNKNFVSTEEWPEKTGKADEDAEYMEKAIEKVISDVSDIQKIAKIEKVKKVSLFIAEDWKFDIYNKIMNEKEKNIGQITKEIMQSGVHEKATLNYIHSTYKNASKLRKVPDRKYQMEVMEEAKHFLEREINCKIEIIDAENSDHDKANASSPNRFGILVE